MTSTTTTMTWNPYFDEAISSAKKGIAVMLGYDVEPTPAERERAARGMCRVATLSPLCDTDAN